MTETIQIISNLISSLGFPIFCVLALGWFLYQIYKNMMNTLDTITDNNKELVETNRELIKGMDIKIDNIENKLDIYITKVDK